ncbi:fibrobacter succinogenes major paralogous domain-containing protein [Maribellus maritimus]|uniref:fibrobacter succinogenes major paralogous domain-containing protein n=1 Tax=Maribellus maritimus TaxID=2870838 RepID=UPI001EEBB747|nr:fibrobacter succinogenes major paralogous domain-containing protein [Maribellus maritimus]MCG6187692.1 fibrobacter succinogenes major paralogous domain-containing protein [Maribellus maritimus]
MKTKLLLITGVICLTIASCDWWEAESNNDEDLIQKVTDFDGNTYNAVKVGEQVWMAENLKVTHYPDGREIPLITNNYIWANQTNNNTSDAYCIYFNDMSGEKDIYGALYTWAAAMGDNAVASSQNPSGVQGVCPSGWHLPSESEWDELIDFVGENGYDGKEAVVLKATEKWTWNNFEDATGCGTDDYNFAALPGGSRFASTGESQGMGYNGNWWTSTKGSRSTDAICFTMYNARIDVSRLVGSKSLGFSVRCVKD